MPNVRKSTSRLFALPEYERAQFDVFFSAVKGLMKAKDSFYAQIPEGDSSEMLPATQNTMPSGQTRSNRAASPSKIKSFLKWDRRKEPAISTLWPNRLIRPLRSDSP